MNIIRCNFCGDLLLQKYSIDSFCSQKCKSAYEININREDEKSQNVLINLDIEAKRESKTTEVLTRIFM